jgi:hypothetical protein
MSKGPLELRLKFSWRGFYQVYVEKAIGFEMAMETSALLAETEFKD